MRHTLAIVAALGSFGALSGCNCGDSGQKDAGVPDGGHEVAVDAGSDAGGQGPVDAGSDAGSVEANDAGTAADAGTLRWLTLVHGTDAGAETNLRDVVLDSAGNLYVVGGTSDPGFPTTAGAYQRTLGRGQTPTSTGSDHPQDVVVMKLDPDGGLVWSTLLGGPNYDRAYGVKVDATGVYVTGRAGDGFPTTTGVVQPAFLGDSSPDSHYGAQDGFVAKLSLDGTTLVWSTYVGDAISAYARDVAVDPAGKVYVAVSRVRSAFPLVTSGAFQPARGGAGVTHDTVVVKLAADATQVIWGSFLGGNGDDGYFPALSVNASGEVTLIQDTASTDGPVTPGAFQSTFGGGATDLLVTRFAADGASLLFSTYIGGNGADDGETHMLFVTQSGEVLIGSSTTSTNLPATAGAIQTALGSSGADPWVARLSADGKRLPACTYLGGRGGGRVEGVVADASGNVVVSGGSNSPDFPVTPNASQAGAAGGRDGFVARLSPDLTQVQFATRIGGSANDDGRAVAVAAGGNVFTVGTTASTDFPTTPGAFQRGFVGSQNAYVGRWTAP